MPDNPKPVGPAGPVTGRGPRAPAPNGDTARAADSVPAPTGPFTALPTQFGRYRIEKLLGKGAMGAVYLAHDTQLDRPVALKVARISASGSAKLIQRMEQEAKAAAKIDHPQICKVYDFGEIDSIRFIALQYIEGEDLKSYLKRVGRKRDPAESVSLLLQIARALEAAHEKGVIHRDLKPENVMLRNGSPVIMDFGLARRASGSTDAGLTQGMIVGTAAYMSPEQALGKAEGIDHRSDLYALGVMLYELLTGDWPFTGTAIEVMGRKCVQDPPSPTTINPTLPRALAELCQRLIARKKEDRFATCAELIAALEAVEQLQSIAPVPATPVTAPIPEQQHAVSSVKPVTPKKIAKGRKKTTSSIAVFNGWWRRTPFHWRWVGLGGASLSVVLAVVLLFNNGKAVVKIVVLADDVQVIFKGDTFSVSDGTKKFTVRPGPQALHILSGELDFDTDSFTLKRGDNPVLTIERDQGEVVTKLGEQVIDKRPMSIRATAKSARDEKSIAPKSATKTDLDRIATGKWVKAVDSTTSLEPPPYMAFQGNVLEMDISTLRLTAPAAGDVILRADVHKVHGQNVNLWLREIEPTGQSAYIAVYDGNPDGNAAIGIYKNGQYTTLAEAKVTRPEQTEFVNMAFAAIGETLSLFMDGQQVVTVKHSEFRRGTMVLGSFQGKYRLQNVEYQILDPAPAALETKPVEQSNAAAKPKPANSTGTSDLDSVATGNWMQGIPDELVELTGNLTRRLAVPIVRDVVMRADCRKVEDGNINLWIREVEPNGRTAYVAWYDGQPNGKAAISIGRDGVWSELASAVDVPRPEGREFINVAISAVGDTITFYIDGKRVVSARNAEFSAGTLQVGAFGGRQQFKNIDYQLLEPTRPAASTVSQVPQLKAISELNRAEVQASAWVSSDGLRIYWERLDKPGGEYSIWQAERGTADKPFGNERVVSKGRQPTLTPDERQMVFVQTTGTNFKRLFTASRASTSEHFGLPTELKQFGEKIFNSPAISANGLSLFVNGRTQADIVSTEYLVSRRKTIGAQWGPMQSIKIRWDVAKQKAPLTWLSMAADELSFLATHELDVGKFRVVRFVRNKKEEPFERFDYLTLPTVGTVYGRSPRYSPATKELFLTAPDLYEKAKTLGGWQENHRPCLWVVQNVDLSAIMISASKGSVDKIGGQSTAKPSSTWNTVFNGKDLTGWTPMRTTGTNLDIQTPSDSGWIVRKDEIVCETNVDGWLRLNKTYGDCEIDFDFNLPHGVNSGLIARYPGQGKLFGSHNCEIQLEYDNQQGKPEQACGGICNIVPPSRNAFRPNAWNQMAVKFQAGTIQVRLNKQLVVDAKTADYTDLKNLPLTGYFGLYNYRGLAKGSKFRNIRVRELTGGE